MTIYVASQKNSKTKIFSSEKSSMTINIDTKKNIQVLIETHRIKSGHADKYFVSKTILYI